MVADGTGTGWQAQVIVRSARAADALMAALAPLAESFGGFEDDRTGTWQITAYWAVAPDRAALVAAHAAAVLAAGEDLPAFDLQPLPDIDWVAENRKSFPPVEAGRFSVRGGHLPAAPIGRFTLRLDAGQAFGSGTHGTTKGCLLALDGLTRQGVRPARVLDVGTGSGILALAAARNYRCPVVATDIDPISVRVAADNAARNRLAPFIRFGVGAGIAAVPKAPGGYPLVFANILARPLMAMAADMAMITAPRGYVILSGLLKTQERAVMSRYRAHGYHRVARYPIDEWQTLVLRAA